MYRNKIIRRGALDSSAPHFTRTVCLILIFFGIYLMAVPLQAQKFKPHFSTGVSVVMEQRYNTPFLANVRYHPIKRVSVEASAYFWKRSFQDYIDLYEFKIIKDQDSESYVFFDRIKHFRGTRDVNVQTYRLRLLYDVFDLNPKIGIGVAYQYNRQYDRFDGMTRSYENHVFDDYVIANYYPDFDEKMRLYKHSINPNIHLEYFVNEAISFAIFGGVYFDFTSGEFTRDFPEVRFDSKVFDLRYGSSGSYTNLANIVNDSDYTISPISSIAFYYHFE